jgi:hypothetical protein
MTLIASSMFPLEAEGRRARAPASRERCRAKESAPANSRRHLQRTIVNAQQLYSQCAKLIGDSFPDGMRGIDPPVPIKGLGFFPVTSGSFHSSALDAPLNRPVMFVGQDFGCEADVTSCRKNPNADIQSGTGLVLHQLIQQSEIPIKECFFTNVLFGVRVGKVHPPKGWMHQNCKGAHASHPTWHGD